MERRTALKVFGALFVCLAGRAISRAEPQKEGELVFKDLWSGPMDYVFSEAGVGNIIIECNDGTKIITPFTEIVEALKGGPK